MYLTSATRSDISFAVSKLVRVIYPGYRGPSAMAQNSGYDRFPPTVNS
jgi:hypothetical protein